MQTNVGVNDIEKWGLRWPVSDDDFGVSFFANRELVRHAADRGWAGSSMLSDILRKD